MCLAPQSSPMPGNHSQWAEPPGPIPCFIMALTLACFCLTLLLALSVLIPENSLGLPLPPCLLECLVHCYPGREMPSSSHTVLCFSVPLHRLCNELAERLDHKLKVSAAQPHSGHCLHLLFHNNSQDDRKDTFKGWPKMF